MATIRHWLPGGLQPPGFDFAPKAERLRPFFVTLRRTIVEPGPDGPIVVGEEIVRYRDGKLVDEVEESPGPHATEREAKNA